MTEDQIEALSKVFEEQYTMVHREYKGAERINFNDILDTVRQSTEDVLELERNSLLNWFGEFYRDALDKW